jgi:hypothetical protein
MKRVTASDARKNWFRLLDEVAGGAVVCIERRGRRIVLRREDETGITSEAPDYSAFLHVPGVEQADQWGWSWSEETGSLEPEWGGTLEPDGDGTLEPEANETPEPEE